MKEVSRGSAKAIECILSYILMTIWWSFCVFIIFCYFHEIKLTPQQELVEAKRLDTERVRSRPRPVYIMMMVVMVMIMVMEMVNHHWWWRWWWSRWWWSWWQDNDPFLETSRELAMDPNIWRRNGFLCKRNIRKLLKKAGGCASWRLQLPSDPVDQSYRVDNQIWLLSKCTKLKLWLVDSLTNDFKRS